MPGHFDCIGAPTNTQDDLRALLTEAVRSGSVRTRPDGGTTTVWRDGSGAAIVVQRNHEGRLVCAKPVFFGTTRLDVRRSCWHADERCPFCDLLEVEVLDEAGEMEYPLALELDDPSVWREAVADATARTLQVTAFAETLRAWESESARAHEDPKVAKLASRSLIPSGLFSLGEEPHVPSAHALITGVIVAADMRTNALTGGRFYAGQVETFGGTYDLVTGPRNEIPDGLVVGSILETTCWLVATDAGPDAEAT